jgi:hypothetical protein
MVSTPCFNAPWINLVETTQRFLYAKINELQQEKAKQAIFTED